MIANAAIRIPDAALARYPAASAAPAYHTHAELQRLLLMLRTNGVRSISVGHGRHCASRTAVAAMITMWTADGGELGGLVTWPAQAASWLRPARALVADPVDAWVIADTPAGFAQLARRLAGERCWSPRRTYGFASLASSDLIELVGTDLSGVVGATATGGSWTIDGRTLICNDMPEMVQR
ncbi:hypothetical protein [Mycobacteroides franklinii]|nr:hypothetical protein [Mycobacteroides franklinii]